jgi:hypothetical protein
MPTSAFVCKSIHLTNIIIVVDIVSHGAAAIYPRDLTILDNGMIVGLHLCLHPHLIGWGNCQKRSQKPVATTNTSMVVPLDMITMRWNRLRCLLKNHKT